MKLGRKGGKIPKNIDREMIVDFRKQQREHLPIHIDRTAVEKVDTFTFLSVHITDVYS